MLEFLSSKVQLPSAVAQALEDRRLVLFCGTGISVYTGLPDFRELTIALFRECGVRLSEWPRRRAELNETLAAEPPEPWDLAFWDKRFDRALALLEQQVGRGEMRRKVMEIVSRPPPAQAEDCALHRDLLDLAALPGGGYRLVATCFDDRFERAAGRDFADAWEAPRIGVPHREHWRSLTFLHGRIRQSADRGAEDLILTSADFGRAYLQDGWAARFAAELFREHTVLFVGYGSHDPAIAHLVDAIAMDRESGRPFRQPYALAGLDEGADPAIAVAQWRSKSIEPILYSSADGHRELHETIAEWAALHRGGFEARLAKARRIMRREPVAIGMEVPADIETLVWALSQPDGSVARAIADGEASADPVQPPRIAWLGALLEWGERMAARRAAPQARDSAGREALGAFLVDGYWLGDPLAPPAQPDPLGGHLRRTPLFESDDGARALHPVAWHLARWILANLHEPTLARIVAERGGAISKPLRDALELELDRRLEPLPGDLEKFWRIVVSARDLRASDPEALTVDRWTHRPGDPGTLDADRRARLLAALKPRIAIAPAWASPDMGIAQDPGGAADASSCRLRALARIELKDYSDRRSVRAIMEWLRTPRQERILADLAGDLGECLVRVLRCAEWIEDREPLDAHRNRLPSLCESRRDDLGHEDWASLVLLCRDALQALAHQDRDLSELLRQRWCRYARESWGALFARLTLHACTAASATAQPALSLLLDNARDALWNPAFDAELRPFLASLGARLEPSALRELERLLRAGPPTGAGPAAGALAEERLAWLATGEATAMPRGTGPATIPSPPRPATPPAAPSATSHLGALAPEPAAIAIAELPDWDAGQAIEACARVKPLRALRIFDILSDWQPERCADLLQWLVSGIADGRNARRFRVTGPRLLPYLGLAEARKEGQGLWGFCAWLHAGAAALPVDGEDASAFWEIWDWAWSAAVDLSGAWVPEDSEPGGRLCAALLERLWKRGREDDSGLPADLSWRFDRLVEGKALAHGQARAILASRLVWLYRIAPAWCDRHVLAPLADCESADSQAVAMWRAFLWPAKISAKLWPALKPALLQALASDAPFPPEERRRLIVFFALNWLRPGAFDEEGDARTLADLLARFDADRLAAIAQGFADALRAAGESAPDLWREQIAPKILDYWPSDSTAGPTEVGERLGAMLDALEEKWPQIAATEAMRRLRAFLGQG